MYAAAALLRLEEEDGAVAEVEVDEVLRFYNLVSTRPKIYRGIALWEAGPIHTVGNKASKVPAYNAVPCGALLVVELLLDVLSDVLGL